MNVNPEMTPKIKDPKKYIRIESCNAKKSNAGMAKTCMIIKYLNFKIQNFVFLRKRESAITARNITTFTFPAMNVSMFSALASSVNMNLTMPVRKNDVKLAIHMMTRKVLIWDWSAACSEFFSGCLSACIVFFLKISGRKEVPKSNPIIEKLMSMMSNLCATRRPVKFCSESMNPTTGGPKRYPTTQAMEYPLMTLTVVGLSNPSVNQVCTAG